jgi:hypothetical protein
MLKYKIIEVRNLLREWGRDKSWCKNENVAIYKGKIKKWLLNICGGLLSDTNSRGKKSSCWCIGDRFPPPHSQILSFCSLYFRQIYSAANTTLLFFPHNLCDDFSPPQMLNPLFLFTSKIYVGHFSDANEKNALQMFFRN